MRILLALLLFATPTLFAQTKSIPSPSKVFVKANDVDCETDRFRSRIVRQLKTRGLIIVDKEDQADFVLMAALEHGTRPVTLVKAKIDVTLKRKSATPFTTTTSWSANVSDADHLEAEAQQTAAKNIMEMGEPVRSVQITDVTGIDRAALAAFLGKQGYKVVESGADLTLSMKVEKTNAIEEEDFANSRFSVSNPAGDSFNSEATVSDPHIYEVPVDVVASVAIKTANGVPAHPYRANSR